MMAYRPDLTLSDATVRRLWADRSLTVDKIAAAAGCSYSTVAKRARGLGLPNRSFGVPVPYDPLLFTRMWQAGVSSYAIARLYRRDQSSISHAAQRLGLPPRAAGFRPKMTLAQFQEQLLATLMAATARREAVAAEQLRRAEKARMQGDDAMRRAA